jgi:hypothetical protein
MCTQHPVRVDRCVLGCEQLTEHLCLRHSTATAQAEAADSDASWGAKAREAMSAA